jgi:hypothetical protein
MTTFVAPPKRPRPSESWAQDPPVVGPLRPIPKRKNLKAAAPATRPSIAAQSLGRLIEIGLLVYLFPVLLAVLAVCAFGLMLVRAGNVVGQFLWVQACKPSHPAGPEIFRS